MGSKTRGNWRHGICLKPCKHQGDDKKCNECIRFSEFEPREEKQ